MATKSRPANETGCIQYQFLTPKYLDAACDVIRTTLFIPGSLNEALGIPDDPEALSELDQLARAAAQDGVSVVAVDKNTDAVAGVAFNKFWVKSGTFLEDFAKSLKNQKSRQILDMIIQTEKMCDVCDLLGVDCVMEIFLLGVSPTYRKRGIAKKLCEVSIDVAQNVNEPAPKAITGIFNSFITQKIGRHLGFEIAAERSNTRIELMGEILEVENDTPTTTLEYKRLTPN